ncbi:MAG: Ig-like domain-containing protein, partial [Clostridia bacterium]|nr:Ig-like domain-containing protein [Clostridia bacterium]
PLKVKIKKGLKKKRAYKAYVKAYAMKDGSKVYLGTSPKIHAYTSGGKGKFTNPKSVTVKKTEVSLTVGGTHQIKAKVKKLKKSKKLIPDFHAVALRYLSSDDTVATVSDSGVVTAKAKGSCKIYVFSVNGVKKTVNVTVQ